VFSWFPFVSLRRIITARSTASSTESILKVIILLFRRSVATATTAVNTGVATKVKSYTSSPVSTQAPCGV